MSITVSSGSESSLLRLNSTVDIGSAAELKAAFVDAFANGNSVRVSLAGVVDLDVTAVQLLWAAKREAKRLGIGFAFEGEPSEALRDSLSSAGFDELAIFD